MAFEKMPVIPGDIITSAWGNHIQTQYDEAKAELDAHLAESASQAHLAKNIGIEDAGNHFTSNHVEGALSELFTSVSNGKNAIASAITDMNQSASGSDSFASLAGKIKDISNDANATTAQVLSGRTFYQGGAKRTGTMTNQGKKILTPTTTNIAIPQGYHDGTGYVSGDSDLKASNIKKGVTIFGVTGNLEEGYPVVSGTNISIYESNKITRFYGSSYTLYEEVTLKVYGTVNVYVRVYAWGYKGDTGNFQVRKNGVTVASGTVTCDSPPQSQSGFYGSASIIQDITVSKGDNIQLYFKWNGVVMENLPPQGHTGMSLYDRGSFTIRVSRSSFIY